MMLVHARIFLFVCCSQFCYMFEFVLKTSLVHPFFIALSSFLLFFWKLSSVWLCFDLCIPPLSSLFFIVEESKRFETINFADSKLVVSER